MVIVYLESPLHIFPLEPEYDESQHAEAVEEAGGDHVHVEQRVDVIQQSEDNPQDPSEQEAGQRGQSVLVNIGDHLGEVALSASRVDL